MCIKIVNYLILLRCKVINVFQRQSATTIKLNILYSKCFIEILLRRTSNGNETKTNCYLSIFLLSLFVKYLCFFENVSVKHF